VKLRRFAAVLVAVVSGAAISGVALATPGSGGVGVQLARGTNIHDGTIPFQAGTDVLVQEVTFAPGGYSGWHSHPGGAIVVFKQGSVTEYRSLGGQCQVTTYGAGQAVIEQPGEVHDWVNTGTDPVIVYVVYPRLPAGAKPRADEPNPGTCPGI
jgi:quercetin dioxygenase-like cupin family protein